MLVIDIKTGAIKDDDHTLQLNAYFHLDTPQGVEFDEVNHMYMYLGKPCPSVTQVIKMKGGYQVDYSKYQMQTDRGTYIHKMCDMYMAGVLDVESVDEKDMGYLNGWIKFISDFNLVDVPFKSEVPMVNTSYNYCGMSDYMFPDEPDGLWNVYLDGGRSYKRRVRDLNLNNFKRFLALLDKWRVRK